MPSAYKESESVLDLDSVSIFAKNKDTLKNTSLDTSKSPAFPMTKNENKVINFDKVVKDYVSSLNLKVTPKSNDALFKSKNGNIVFIEFKNGKLSDREKFELKGKIFESVIILTELSDKTTAFFREHMEYVLVFNEEACPQEKISSAVYKNSSKQMIKFGLEYFKGYLFKEVQTITQKRFNQDYIPNNF